MDEFKQTEIDGPESGEMGTELLRPQSRLKKKTLPIITAIFLLLVFAVGFLWVVTYVNHDEHTTEENYINTSGDENVNPDAKSEKTEEEIIELSLDDGLVQRLYRNFDYASFPDANRFSFYFDKNAMAGNPNRELMLSIARDNTVTRFCKGDHYDHTGVRWSECYSGSEIAQKIEEIFGQKLTFTEDDIIEGRGCFGWYYDTTNNEFYHYMFGCGNADPRRVARKLYAAAKDTDYVYLYELAIYTDTAFVYHIGEETMAGNLIGNMADLGIEVDAQGAILRGDVEYYKDLLGQDKFKWTFVWNGENYIFESLEKI